MAIKPPTRADQALLQELKRRNCPVREPQIDRWRYWRKTGLISRTVKYGEGRGSRSEHPDLSEAADRVEEVHGLRQRYRELDAIALVLSARGRPLDPASVKAALLSTLASVEKHFRSHKPRSDDATETAANAARAVIRSWSRLGGKPTSTPKPATREALLIFGQVLLGNPPTAEQILRALNESPLEPITTLLALPLAPLAQRASRAATKLSFAELAATADTAASTAVAAALHEAHEALMFLKPLNVFPTEGDYDATVVGCALGILTAQQQPS